MKQHERVLAAVIEYGRACRRFEREPREDLAKEVDTALQRVARLLDGIGGEGS